MGLFGMGLGRGVAHFLNLAIAWLLTKYYDCFKDTITDV